MNLDFISSRKFEIMLLTLVLILMSPVILTAIGMRMYPVISNSMSHLSSEEDLFFEDEFYKLWEDAGYIKDEVESFPLANGFIMGDMIITLGDRNLSIGDVVVWESNTGRITTHRLLVDNGSKVAIVPDRFPNASSAFRWVNSDEITGKVISVIPKVGIFSIFISCMQNKNCGPACFFDTQCLRSSFG